MGQADFSIDMLLQETLKLTEYLRVVDPHFMSNSSFDELNLSLDFQDFAHLSNLEKKPEDLLPSTFGIIYKIDNGEKTFCVRGFSTLNIKNDFLELENPESQKRNILKLDENSDLGEIRFFETKNFENAEAIREHIMNRRFPHQEDAVCNLSDPGYSWWMNIGENGAERFQIFFRSHGVNRADKYIQLGPIGDASVAPIRMNQARSLLLGSFPINEFSCDEKSFTVASSKPDHLSFHSFKDIFLKGINNTELENFPDDQNGRTLFYYFHELAVVRKFWIEVKEKVG